MIKATHEGIMNIKDSQVDVAVLEDGRRLIGVANNSLSESIPVLVNGVEQYQDVISQMLVDNQPVFTEGYKVSYIAKDGSAMVGYDSSVVADVAEYYMKYSDAMRENNLEIPDDLAKQISLSLKTMTSLAIIGMQALIDEKTGYQEVRGKSELQELTKS